MKVKSKHILAACLVSTLLFQALECPQPAPAPDAKVEITVQKVSGSTVNPVAVGLNGIPTDLIPLPDWDVYMFKVSDFVVTGAIATLKDKAKQMKRTSSEGVATFSVKETAKYVFVAFYIVSGEEKSKPSKEVDIPSNSKDTFTDKLTLD